jgi:protein-S-isoprenylcysteine O-methyltransferase Ste14
MVLILSLVESLPPLTQDVHTPTFRGALYGTLMSLVLIFLLTLRTLDEEELLVNELDGYVAYPEKVKDRLLPFVW